MDKKAKEEAEWLIGMLKAHIKDLGYSAEECNDVSMSARLINRAEAFLKRNKKNK